MLGGDAGPNLLSGTAGNDILLGDLGNDTLMGDAGTDTVDYSSFLDPVTVVLGAGSSTGAADTDALSSIENATGGGGQDVLIGDAGANALVGNGGDDTLTGFEGNDTLDGGGSSDLIDYSSAGAGVTVNLSSVAAQNTGGAGTDTIVACESVLGSNYADTLTGNVADNELIGLGGDDTLSGGSGDDLLDGDLGTDTVDYSSSGFGVTVDLSSLGSAGDRRRFRRGHAESRTSRAARGATC